MNNVIVTEKKCCKCGVVKPSCEFGKSSERKDGLKVYCKVCRRTECDPEKDKLRKQKWYSENRELTIDRSKSWVNNNKDKRRKIALKHIKQDIINNPHKYAWRSLLNNSLNRLGKPKEGHTIDLLGYSAVVLRQHIESLFTDGMTWDNYGEWHIDHIIGVINWDKDTHPSIVNALSNLRPLWATTREINGVIYEGNLNRIKFQ